MVYRTVINSYTVNCCIGVNFVTKIVDIVYRCVGLPFFTVAFKNVYWNEKNEMYNVSCHIWIKLLQFCRCRTMIIK